MEIATLNRQDVQRIDESCGVLFQRKRRVVDGLRTPVSGFGPLDCAQLNRKTPRTLQSDRKLEALEPTTSVNGRVSCRLATS